MRNSFKVLITLVVCLCLVASAKSQNSSKKTFKKSVSEFISSKRNYDTHKSGSKYFIQAQFAKTPSRSNLEALSNKGIEILSYKGDNIYWLAVDENITEQSLSNSDITTVLLPEASSKLSPTLYSKDYPEWASHSDGAVEIAIQFHEGTTLDQIEEITSNYDINVTKPAARNARLVEGIIDINTIETIADHPLIAHVDAIQSPDQMLNYENRNNHAVSYVHSSNGFDLRGNGVVVGIGDGGELGDHIDFGNRVINYATGTYSSFGAHGDHVAGIIGGGGTVNTRHRGMAPEATLITQKTSLISYYAPDYITDHGMVVTNNSYGTSFDCETNGVYNYTSSNLDAQSNEYPQLLHVFASGNSGGSTCAPFPQGYKTVLRYYQASKNVLTVGNLQEDMTANTRSSRGPVDDGRIKPEICAVGTDVYSVDRAYGYWKASGTSMSAPTVTGVVALMIEAYRAGNGSDPDGGLMKAIACNTADDLGNEGPDYIYGFGGINAKRAVQTVNENRFVIDNIATGESKSHTINVGANTKQLKVMLYWTDKEAEAYPEKVLINDLNLVVNTPSSESFEPWVLNPDPNNVADPATRGVDSLNNIEQVTIDNPAAGQYTIDVSGFDVPVGPQTYYIVYEAITDDVVLNYPMGGECMEPGTNELITWNTDPKNTSTFKLEYSTDNGASWQTINDNIAATARNYTWSVPSTYTEQGKVRITKNGGNLTDQNEGVFSVMTIPALVEVSPKCEGRVFLEWEAVDYATGYEIMMYDGTEMSLFATTTETTHIINDGFDIGAMYWFAVRAISNSGIKSQMTLANSVVTEFDAVCPWDNEGLIKPLLKRKAGRVGTNSELGGNEEISVIIKNIGTADMTEFTVYCSMNGGDPVSQVVSQLITPGDSMSLTFDQTIDCSMPGEYEIQAWLEIPGDATPENDSLTSNLMFVQIENDAATLPFENDFQNLQTNSYSSDYLGIEQLDHWDFETSGNGYLETSSEGYFTLASQTNPVEGDFNAAIMTLDLTSYEDASQRIMLSFDYGSNDMIGLATIGGSFTATNSVYVRGNDMEDWVLLMDLQNKVDWTATGLLDVTQALTDAGQSLSSSTQIKFSQLDAMGFSFKNVEMSLADPLPVELSYFKVKAVRNDVIITWQTASEFQNDFFEVQVGAKNHDQIEWRTIGRVDGQGYSSTVNNYEFIDVEKEKVGERYYRLVQHDFNGDRNLSPIRVLQFSTVTKSIELYPNPFVSGFNIHLESSADQVANVIITDALGVMVDHQRLELFEGTQDVNIDLGVEVEPGMYYIQVNWDGKIESYPLTKVRM